jgi:hypothetical protein
MAVDPTERATTDSNPVVPTDARVPVQPMLRVTAPPEGAVVSTRELLVAGVTCPGCVVGVGDRWFADVASDGVWQLTLMVEPGDSTITVTATDPETELKTSRTRRVRYEPAFTVRSDGLGPLDFGTPEEETVAYLIGVLGPPDSDRSSTPRPTPDLPLPCYERVLTWTRAGIEVEISQDGGRAPAGRSYACSQPPGLAGWRVEATSGGPHLRTPDGIAVGDAAAEVCNTYGQTCAAEWVSVYFAPDYFPWDHSRPRMGFWFDKPAEGGTARLVGMGAWRQFGSCRDHEAAVARLQYRASLLGTWEGTVATPWTEPYPVVVEFSDRRYRAINLSNVAPAALYYGTDQQWDGDPYQLGWRWEISGLDDGVGYGWLSILMDSESDDVREAALSNIRISDSGNTLGFDLEGPSGTEPGPIHFQGSRASP